MAAQVDLPYFDTVLQLLDQNNPDFQKAFGRHVHWGFWEDPRQADGSVEDFALAAESMCDRIFQVANIESEQKILDVGCGFGGTIASLNERWQHLELVGVNIDQRQLDRASSLVVPALSNSINFVKGDACQLPFPDNSFDRVLAVECIFHFPSRKRFFAEAQRVLRPGGRLFVSDIVPTPLLLSLKNLIQPLLGPALAKTFGDMDNEFAIKNYIQLAEEYQFTDQRILDITRQTLPTHPFMRSMYKKNANDVYRRQLAQELTVEFLSRTGLLRYVLLSWRAGLST